jgi:methionine synthase I (cobalamin-dependent)
VVRLKIDTSEFNAAMLKFKTYSKKTLPELLNRAAYYISQAAYSLTQKADVEKIKREIGPTSEDVVGHEVKFRRVRRTKKEATGG